MYVLIDDLRDINKLTADTVREDEKLVLRTYKEGMKFIKHTNLTDITLFMDNDLGDALGHEGYHILSHAIDHGNYPKTVILVTSNPVAHTKMARLLMNTDQYKRVGSIFMRYDSCQNTSM
ncbi:hypothetical protein VPFG_00355 [Vibrio phage nt-1]|uniref:Cyclic-phosphate processing Receiver domain-containing protein n=1 Tax=Vibrio phage nt-1 TaxID=115992 RepID=R9TJT5_9CAUD|nr:hypothetical protein VPFG_00355 [Vibrio phage nt-1]AGN30352.1 hypothetical protein VPFG_00355 [Vibrio phage nt-1]